MDYLSLRALHASLALASGGLFLLRGLWMWRGSARPAAGWLRWLPQLIDSLLLAAGLALVCWSAQWPWETPWLAAKLTLLLAYIGLGLLALRPGRALARRRAALLAALGLYLGMLGLALVKPWA